jgi:hypothetical protein
VYFQLWEGQYALGDHRERAIEAHERLRRFARVFPIGRPRYRQLQGRRAWLLGRHGRAKRAFAAAVASAEALRMPYEAALAHLELGRRLDSSDPERVHHLERSQEIFRSIGIAGSAGGA